jgi:hypothetical protein
MIAEQKAAYILLTAAMYHAQNSDVTQLLTRVRDKIAKEMPIESVLESTILIELLVWPRFS